MARLLLSIEGTPLQSMLRQLPHVAAYGTLEVDHPLLAECTCEEKSNVSQVYACSESASELSCPYIGWDHPYGVIANLHKVPTDLCCEAAERIMRRPEF